MSQSEVESRITELPVVVKERLNSIIQSKDESELRLISKTFSDLHLFVNSYGQYVNFSVKISNPIKYIKPDTLGLPTKLTGFEHPKINKLIYDTNKMVDSVTIQPNDFTIEFYDSLDNTVLYYTRLKINFNR